LKPSIIWLIPSSHYTTTHISKPKKHQKKLGTKNTSNLKSKIKEKDIELKKGRKKLPKKSYKHFLKP
jgi:hypothetical protein